VSIVSGPQTKAAHLGGFVDNALALVLVELRSRASEQARDSNTTQAGLTRAVLHSPQVASVYTTDSQDATTANVR
jgi:hypothetical protein